MDVLNVCKFLSIISTSYEIFISQGQIKQEVIKKEDEKQEVYILITVRQT
ncbi:unnamed protein product [Paramecium octaurelia]|uniref:Uncharacterized protein n=1 Tax=Paramecium octaurelia TaxID=43137 RepID=A0A8S1YRX9_PAROT|nr:unnamed protein product [Paramecium octaurelia]CAD8215542.1 unnamed protein product [Paramecium octaurelia]